MAVVREDPYFNQDAASIFRAARLAAIKGDAQLITTGHVLHAIAFSNDDLTKAMLAQDMELEAFKSRLDAAIRVTKLQPPTSQSFSDGFKRVTEMAVAAAIDQKRQADSQDLLLALLDDDTPSQNDDPGAAGILSNLGLDQERLRDRVRGFKH